MERLKNYIGYSPEVKKAMAEKKPLVALESTIISHGMPYPDNVRIASEVEELVRQQGAVPATIGILAGKIKIGLTGEELEFFGKSKKVLKTSRRDLAYVVSTGNHGATTVSGTMICAAMAGIKVFVTGGLGGVHRGVNKTWDISADLNELINTDVAVVCAGVKSILDIPKTLEVLETGGVPVLGYKTDIFPAFFAVSSGSKVDYRMDTPEEIARFVKTKWGLGLKGGVVIGNPVPAQYAMDEKIINAAIETALTEADSKGIQGKEITPFLLSKVKELTGGKSLNTNEALVKNNAELGAKIALSMERSL